MDVRNFTRYNHVHSRQWNSLSFGRVIHVCFFNMYTTISNMLSINQEFAQIQTLKY